MREKRPGRRLLNQLTQEMLTWLDTPNEKEILDQTAAWDESTWNAARRVVTIQGIGPYLHHTLGGRPIFALLPSSFRDWLAAQYSMNALRISRMHQELKTILRETNRSGLPVMPLKGCLLSLRYYDSPALRPMADLDLLTTPAAEDNLAKILKQFDYLSLPPDNLYAQERHRRFIRRGKQAVVFWDGEHPDNPFPVEVHTSLHRVLWGDVLIPDLSDLLWSSAQETELLGEHTWEPAAETLLIYLAVHTLEHLMIQTGRVIQWIDLALVAQVVRNLGDPPQANWVYPPLALAARCLPEQFRSLDLSQLARKTDARLRQWAESVPLDGSCGLRVDPLPPRLSGWRIHWGRWNPAAWRLVLAYGSLPTPLAWARHLLVMLAHLRRRAGETAHRRLLPRSPAPVS